MTAVCVCTRADGAEDSWETARQTPAVRSASAEPRRRLRDVWAAGSSDMFIQNNEQSLEVWYDVDKCSDKSQGDDLDLYLPFPVRF